METFCFSIPKFKGEGGKLVMKEWLGQFFSSKELVNFSASLIKNSNGVLEPSCGDGSFEVIRDRFVKSVFIELDRNVISGSAVLNMDFFDYPSENIFGTIIGNPPYVEGKSIIEETKRKLSFDLLPPSANLYLHFIYKCFLHLENKGELIFIVPRDFIKSTASAPLNKLLFDNGSFTDFYEFGDRVMFKDAAPNICVFRYEKGNFFKKTNTFSGIKEEVYNEGQICFLNKKYVRRISDFFDVSVGAVSGKDELFERESGEEFVCSFTNKTGLTKRMIYNQLHPELIEHKQTLLDRKIKNFCESNWFEWGRCVNFRENEPRIYVNTKTRIQNPFFLHSATKWDGSILALFPKIKMDLDRAVEILNKQDWEELGFKVGGRFIFQQKSLLNSFVDFLT